MWNKEFIQEQFYFNDDSLIYFNHGTYGICPRPVLEEKFRILRKIEANPVVAFAETMFEGCLENTKILAVKLGVSYRNLALIENVTTGFQSVMQSIEVKEGDEILLTNFTYDAIRMIVEEVLVKKGCIIRTLYLDPPFLSNEDIVRIYKSFVQDHPRIKYAIIDHISSGLPFVQPVKDITKTLRDLGVLVLIDGAHVPGHLKDLNLLDIDADVYIGNLHKWYFLPRGTGFVAVRDDLDIYIQPPVISHLHHMEFYLRFVYLGTKDFSNVLCVKSAFDFVEKLGGLEVIHSAIVEMLELGVSYLEKTWKVTRLSFPEMAPFVRLIPLPKGFSRHREAILEMIRKPFQRELYSYTLINHDFIATIVSVKDVLHFRVCCHIYHDLDHFVHFSERVLDWLNILNQNDEDTFTNNTN